MREEKKKKRVKKEKRKMEEEKGGGREEEERREEEDLYEQPLVLPMSGAQRTERSMRLQKDAPGHVFRSP